MCSEIWFCERKQFSQCNCTISCGESGTRSQRLSAQDFRFEILRLQSRTNMLNVYLEIAVREFENRYEAVWQLRFESKIFELIGKNGTRSQWVSAQGNIVTAPGFQQSIFEGMTDSEITVRGENIAFFRYKSIIDFDRILESSISQRVFACSNRQNCFRFLL